MTHPQIAELVHSSLPTTIYGVKWVPGTAKFVVLGSQPNCSGLLQIYELEGPQLAEVARREQPASLKCGSFGAGGKEAAGAAAGRHLALGDQDGRLQLLNVERLDAGPLFNVQAHVSIVHGLDAFQGQGAPEVVTCGHDGVRVWDTRQPEAPAAAFLPAPAPAPGVGSGGGQAPADCWCVSIGNSYTTEERCVLAGYANGDIKMFDLRAGSVRWETNVGKGVCGVQFDRKDIAMNKFVATCLKSQLCLFDARTQHPAAGFAGRVETVARDATLWGVQHLPQNRDVFMVTGGDGSLSLHKYRYPDQRAIKDRKSGELMGVAGSTERICDRGISCQPVSGFDWSPDKAGLFVASAFDQTVRLGIVTQVSTL